MSRVRCLILETFLLAGVEQAKLTGDRLVALNLPYDRMVRSTMTRAQQTGDHILTRMKTDSLIVENDNMLEEGAPFPPEPPRKTWEPPEHVSLFVFCFLIWN